MALRGAWNSLRRNGPIRVFQCSRDTVLQGLGDVVTLAGRGHQRPGCFAVPHGDGVQSKLIWVRDVDHAHTDVVAEVQISQCVGHGLDTL